MKIEEYCKSKKYTAKSTTAGSTTVYQVVPKQFALNAISMTVETTSFEHSKGEDLCEPRLGDCNNKKNIFCFR